MSTLKQLKDLNSKRREVLAKCLGAQSSEQLGILLGRKVDEPPRTDDLLKLSLPVTCGPSRSKISADDTKQLVKAKSADRRTDTTEKNQNAIRSHKKHKSSSHRSSSSSSSRKCESLPRTTSNNISTTQDAFIVAKRSMDNLVDGPIPAAKRAKARAQKTGEVDEEVESFDDYFQALKEEEKVYKSSISFLKGTQSANPHNDYSQYFVDTGQRPQNFIRDIGLNERFDEYPKLKELIKLKDKLVSDTAAPPMYLKTDLRNWDPQQDLGSRFDVILIEPPLEEYFLHTSASRPDDQAWTWDQIEKLDIGSLADSRCFLWLWCGSSPEGLDRGRQCFKKWGFRRCEDICWVKRNCFSTSQGNKRPPDPSSLFQRTKEHCLMGIKGTVRRSTDGDFIHANVDIDLIITEESSSSTNIADVKSLSASSSLTHPFAKPLEIFLLAEHFCLGRRRIHLFGRDDTIRPGWVTAGPSLTSSNFDQRKYRRFFARENGGLTTGCTDRVENLRPKSPTPASAGAAPNITNASGQQTQQASSMSKNLTKIDMDRRQTFASRKMIRR